MSIDKFGGYKTYLKMERKKRPALRKKVKEEEHLEVYGGVKRRGSN